MSAITDAVNATANPTAVSTSTSASNAANGAGTAVGFLKLLTAQLQNQDPTNPVDNAQLTSQIAQINTVDGITKLNTTVSGLSSQFMQMQVMQGTSLLGRDVTVPGSTMTMDATTGTGSGGYAITSDATDVTVKVLDGNGNVVDTVDLGAATSGNKAFTWTPPPALDKTANYTFKVAAVNGANSLPATALMNDKVISVNTGGDTLTLQLQHSGSTPYASVTAVD